MEMIVIDQSWIGRIAPAFGIEMQTKHKIRMQFSINQDGAATDLAVAIKKHFALPSNRFVFFGIVWIENVGPRLRQAVLDKNFSGEFLEIARPLRSDRVGAVTDVQHCGAQFS